MTVFGKLTGLARKLLSRTHGTSHSSTNDANGVRSVCYSKTGH